MGTEGEVAALTFTARLDSPNVPSRKRHVWWDEGKAVGFLTWAGGFAV